MALNLSLAMFFATKLFSIPFSITCTSVTGWIVNKR